MSSRFEKGHALVIGVGADLPNTVDDAKGLAGILRDEARCAYPPAQVHLLTGSAATRQAVLDGLDALAQRTDEEDTVVVYFSGHGYEVSTSVDDVYFLMPYGYDVNRLKTTAIKGSEFTAKLRAIPAGKVLVLLDCCHAGGVGEAKAPYIEKLNKVPLPPEATALLAEGSGRVLIASSREDELSYAGKPYSAFTLALIEALSGVGVAKKDGYVRVADVALHARQVVPGRTDDRQHPILHFEHADNFVLAYYAGGDVEPKGVPFDVEPQIEPEPGAWRARMHGSGALAQGDRATALGERAVQVRGNVGGDVVTGRKRTTFDQRGSEGAVYRPSGQVRQHYGDSIRITGDGNVIGDNSRSTVIKPEAGEVTPEQFRVLLADLGEAVRSSALDEEVRAILLSDLQTVEAQVEAEQPRGAIVVSKLQGVSSLLATADGVLGIGERALPLARQAVDWARRLFGAG